MFPYLDVKNFKTVAGLVGPIDYWLWWAGWGLGAGLPSSLRLEGVGNGVILRYTVHPRGAGTEQPLQVRVGLDWTRCNYGGHRPWWRCPAGCDRRVRLLYFINHHFYCRRCHHLAYDTQNENHAGRLLLKARRIRTALGGSPSLLDPLPPKPKGMHWSTYYTWLQQEEAAKSGYLSELMKPFSAGRIRY